MDLSPHGEQPQVIEDLDCNNVGYMTTLNIAGRRFMFETDDATEFRTFLQYMSVQDLNKYEGPQQEDLAFQLAKAIEIVLNIREVHEAIQVQQHLEELFNNIAAANPFVYHPYIPGWRHTGRGLVSRLVDGEEQLTYANWFPDSVLQGAVPQPDGSLRIVSTPPEANQPGGVV